MSATIKRYCESRLTAGSSPANGGGVAVESYSFDSSDNVLGVFDGNAGRWLSNDPIGIGGGLNQYAFCANNPVMFVDPEGKEIIYWGTSEEQAAAKAAIKAIHDRGGKWAALIDALETSNFKHKIRGLAPPNGPGARPDSTDAYIRPDGPGPGSGSTVYVDPINPHVMPLPGGGTATYSVLAVYVHELLHAYLFQLGCHEQGDDWRKRYRAMHLIIIDLTEEFDPAIREGAVSSPSPQYMNF